MVINDENTLYVYCESIAKRLYDKGYEELTYGQKHEVWLMAETELRDDVITQIEYDFRYERGA